MNFQQALAVMCSREVAVRRAAWHPDVAIFRTNESPFVGMLWKGSPNKAWQPYLSDFSATDWEVEEV